MVARTAFDEMGKDGSFQRTDSAWRNWISREPGAQFPPESKRYHLYVACACPWAHRALITRGLKGLEDAISISVVHPVWKKTKPDDLKDTHCGWVFGDPNGKPYKNTSGLGGPFPPAFTGNEPDPIFGAKSIREVYEKCNDTDGKYTVPILFDKKLNTIVSNESSEIIRMLNSEFNEFARCPELDLYPEDLVDPMEAINNKVYSNLNNGVYQCGFATTQSAYDKAIDDLTKTFDEVDCILQGSRFLTGDKLTLTDIRLFVTLVRFDEVYTVYFKTNTRSVTHTPALLNYCRDIYQMTGVAETLGMEQIKTHYFASHPMLNKWSVIPRGTDFEKLLQESHNRHNM